MNCHNGLLKPPLLAAVAVSSLLIAGCGRGEKSLPEVQADMMKDKAFVENLKSMRSDGGKIMSERAAVVAKMDKLIAEAKAQLAASGVKDPDDSAVKAELEGNPDKYPQWKELYAKVVELNGRYSENKAKMREAARERMIQEAKDRKAVETGAARAAGK